MVGTATFEKGAKIGRMERNLDDPSAALKAIGALMVSESQAAFRQQAFGGQPWQQRGPVNVFGIIADFHAGKKSPPARRFQRSPALKDTGALSASISFNLIGTDVVEVGTNLSYAAVHQFGGEVESLPINDTVRKGLWAWLKKQGDKTLKKLGWLLNKKFKDKTLKSKVPARPFVGITAKTRDYVRRTIGREIMEVE